MVVSRSLGARHKVMANSRGAGSVPDSASGSGSRIWYLVGASRAPFAGARTVGDGGVSDAGAAEGGLPGAPPEPHAVTRKSAHTHRITQRKTRGRRDQKSIRAAPIA